LRREADERGGDIPEHLYPPPCPVGYEPWVDAFWDASTERQYGMGIGPIPASAIDKAASDLGLDDIETEMLTQIMRRLDGVFLSDAGKKMGKPGAGAPAQVSSRPMSIELFDAVFG